MDHDQTEALIHPYIDGELDAANATDMEQHLRECEECRSAELRIRSLRTALANSSPGFRAPSQLRADIRSAIRRETKSTGDSQPTWLGWLAPVAALALLIIGSVFLQNSRATRDRIVDEVIADHVRSLLATHLVDVASSDQHTVKPWFNGKIDFAPEVRDFAGEGFPLIGGRLDYLKGETVVALVYRRNQHPINLLVMPAQGTRDTRPSGLTRRGYNVQHWIRHEMEYWAVSDVNADELRQFAGHYTRQSTP
jgi:anti-sigma factor RsiW